MKYAEKLQEYIGVEGSIYVNFNSSGLLEFYIGLPNTNAAAAIACISQIGDDFITLRCKYPTRQIIAPLNSFHLHDHR